MILLLILTVALLPLAIALIRLIAFGAIVPNVGARRTDGLSQRFFRTCSLYGAIAAVTLLLCLDSLRVSRLITDYAISVGSRSTPRRCVFFAMSGELSKARTFRANCDFG